ncbi:hypothetical protein RNZ50_19555 [Paracoccaceae bacterium Fryx2]|nr:hypothetical protein [Paracoccaceae bacterium Fryx2]
MTIRNWLKNEEGKSNSWPIAGAVGFVTFVGMVAAGEQSDVNAIPVAGLVTFFFGGFLEWAFWGRDPETQMKGMLEYMTPTKMMEYPDFFGVSTYDHRMEKMRKLVARVEPKELMKVEGSPFASSLNTVPPQLLRIEAALAPKGLMTYDDMGTIGALLQWEGKRAA